MILLIKTNSEVIPLALAENCKLSYTKVSKYKQRYDNTYEALDANFFYKDEEYPEGTKDYYLVERPENPIINPVKIDKENLLIDSDLLLKHWTGQFEIKQRVDTAPTTALMAISVIESKINGMTEQIKRISTFNEKVNVHIGGHILAQIDEVLLEEDCCSDQLQRQLDEGYRIIAVCVQPDQRRPDYILGRSKL